MAGQNRDGICWGGVTAFGSNGINVNAYIAHIFLSIAVCLAFPCLERQGFAEKIRMDEYRTKSALAAPLLATSGAFYFLSTLLKTVTAECSMN